MRGLMVAMMLLGGATAWAQPTDAPAAKPDCWPSSHIDKVVVQMTDGTTRHGSLLCLGSRAFILAEKQAVAQLSLADVRRIRKAPDPMWDGAAKGASVSLLMLVLCNGRCSAEAIARTAVGYGLLGLALDGIDTNADTIYRPSLYRPSPPASLGVGFHLRF